MRNSSGSAPDQAVEGVGSGDHHWPQVETRLLAAAKQPLRDLIIIMQDTGMRPQDVFRLRWEHVNWQKRTVFIPHGKTKNSRRYVPMSERVNDALLSRAKGSSEWGVPFSSLEDGTPNHRGEPMAEDTAERGA
jgi:integrase